ncbi:hypothetical protein [Clostridium botulinum]|uniref:Uncharacterized protein n=1 Tax=Clostridium botulinum TaxID=1491 RepID=A0A0L9YAV3_CLOBO|nr:hypothetical protein [Clostridium botulinum]KAI3350773.1 hypothetical protein CIT18_01670 [Clostridium botulinum]KOM88773.1 hypothetical protein ACP51_05930 [Clostridium botulinum]KOR57609.1 hypothetical protein ADT22_12620 [Clostridium botulinum]NFE58171.1 hypothetical protein [Clostridium botulinum]NFE94508.1 hypothetical protein [Clostridium botulinum]
MKNIYACLIGNWVNLCDDPNCKIGSHRTSPLVWWEENAEIWSPSKKEDEHTMYQQDYVHIYYLDKDYRIHPSFIQIVES